MTKLTIKSGKGQLVLTKSDKYLGLKAKKSNTKSRGLEPTLPGTPELPNLGGFKMVSINTDEGSANSQLDAIRASKGVEVGTHVYHTEGSTKPIIPTGEIFIRFETGVGENEQMLCLNEFHLKMVERRSTDTLIAVVTKESPNPIKCAVALQATSMVAWAEPDLDMPVDEYFSLPTDNLLTDEWHLRNTGRIPTDTIPALPGADAKVVDAWNRLGGFGSDKVTVAILDNGLDLNHPDLIGNVVKPFDFWTGTTELTEDPSFTHGTPCASVAIARPNGRGIVGAAPNARFMPLSGTSFSDRLTEQYFDYCIQNGADIISCSWGTTEPGFSLGPRKEAAISKAAREGRGGKGIVVLFAAGNDGLDYVNFYGTHPNVICVAASTSEDTYPTYSNRGPHVHIAAPSNGGNWNILAARARWDAGLDWEEGLFKFYRDGVDRGNLYKHFGGTSSSTPLVAGICALMLSANPNLTAKEVKEILQKTADRIGSPLDYDSSGRSVKFGYGKVNADRAVAEAIRRKEGATAPATQVEAPVTAGKGLFRFSVAKQDPKGFGVQVGVFQQYGNVLIAAEKLQKQFGQPILVNISEADGKTLYKVAVGAFSKTQDAKNLQKDMDAKGVKGFVVDLKNLA